MEPIILTEKQQELLIHIRLNESIQKAGQDIYNSAFFYNRISELMKSGLVMAFRDDKFKCSTYTLTTRGKILVNILLGNSLKELRMGEHNES